MRSAHTVEQVRAAEDALLAVTPDGALMQRAAAGLASAIGAFLGRVYGARVLLLVGAGNNGGDALYAGARLARRGAHVEAVLLDPGKAHAPGLTAFHAAGGLVVDEPRACTEGGSTSTGGGSTFTGGGSTSNEGRVDGRAYDVVVDGIVGIGASGPLRPDAAGLVASLVACLPGVPFVAVDVPSGVDVDTGRVDGPHVRADLTVTFGTHKIAHLVDPAADSCGAPHSAGNGLDLPAAPVAALQADDVRALLPRPAADAQKYTRGVVGVRSGSDRYRGAGVLSVSGANCGLVGMVRYVPAEADPDESTGQGAMGVADLVQAAHPEVVVGEGRVQAWVVGSGGGDSARDQLRAALADGVPVVVDADALAALDGPVPVAAVLTPHAGELARMLGVEREAVESDQLRYATEAASRFQAVVLLKNRHTLAAAPDGRVRVTTVGPPWLATAGAGDVLAGLVGALLAAGLEPFDAASVGSWVHGAAAGVARSGGPITAGEVARAIPELCARLLRSWEPL
ncbi:MAG: ADP-dependent NAD(P)H-hydrate dehydratase / NAD(P)H-hydrate epimerase [Nocardioidaceae bacterium]|nr:ADP-dependent NAD(P)H-hydrate dehydratase / NAD(P)H-hydrate epimerase [Nocardioidaceae bacterium]